jgi:hypothetical protein
VPVGGGVVNVLAILIGQRRPSLVDHAGKDGETAKSGVGTTGRPLS